MATLTIVAPAVLLHAQGAVPIDSTPLGCLRAARDYESTQYQAAQTAKTPVDLRAIHAQAIARAKTCSAQFDPATVPAEQRPSLGFLYMTVGDVANAKNVLGRAERDLPADPDARATTLVQLLQAYGGNPNRDTALADGQRIVKVLDGVQGAHGQKLVAHGSLLSAANGLDLDVLARDNVAAILTLVPRLSPDEQKQYARVLANAYETRAAHQGDDLHPDSAVMTLRDGIRVLTAIPQATAHLENEIKRYEMVGKPAPTIHADYWINSPARPLKGATTVLVFTANWCHSCHTAYPAIEAVMKAYPASRLQTVFSVSLDGQFEGAAMTPPQEVEANRKYFVTEHHFSNPIAVQRNPGANMPASDSVANAESYVLNYLPQVVVIDQQGIVRAVLQGWDEAGNRERSFRAVLTKVLGK